MPVSTLTHASFTNLDCEIHYWHRPGTGDKYVLFFHGAILDHRMFDLQLSSFDDTYHLILWDARGHGQSRLPDGRRFDFGDMISDCLELYKALGIEKAVLIGQSMGGQLAQEIAYYHPEMVERMVLIGCSRNTGKLTLMEKLTIPIGKLILYYFPWKMLTDQVARACGNREDVREYVKTCSESLGKAASIDIFFGVFACLHEDTSYRFRQPVLLLFGANDRTGNIRKIAQGWADSDDACVLHMIEDAAHNANQDQPEVVNRLIREFVQSV